MQEADIFLQCNICKVFLAKILFVEFKFQAGFRTSICYANSLTLVVPCSIIYKEQSRKKLIG